MEAFELDVTKPREASPRPSLASVFSAALSALIVLIAIGVLYGLVAIFDPGDKTTAKGAIAVLGPLVAFILIVAGRLVSPVQVQESRKRFEFPEQFAQNFRELLDEVNVDRVVIAIDNLDRCSPKRVAEVLTTIKTFLEPALEGGENPGAKSLCFIIAADDEALRRHLIAQELAASTGVSEESSAPRRSREESNDRAVERQAAVDGPTNPAEVARRSVDEYLRKFFNGSIRIAEMLDEDMREFSRRELEDFIASHQGIDGTTADKLVELTAHGLKRNPRRIKQFINNLELRLQLFADRRAAGHIQIPPDILLVAKLAILEEDFPDEHEALRKKPSLMEHWHEQAEQADAGGLNSDLVAFLRFTNNIRSPHIATYLTMKQTKDELELPGYSDFVAMLDEARTSMLEKNLAPLSAEEIERHAVAAKTHFDREIDARAWASAYGTARSVIENQQLRSVDSAVRHVLDRCLAHQELKVRLIDLEPRLLLEVGLANLGSTQKGDLVEAMMAGAQGKNASPERREQLSAAFAHNTEQLEPEVKQRLAVAFRDPELRQDFAAYADLAEKLPEILSRELVSKAVEALEEDGGFNPSDPRFRVALASRSLLSKDSRLAERLLRTARAALDAHRSEAGSDFVELANRLDPVVAAAPNGDELAQLAQDIDEKWSETHEDLQWPSLEFGLKLCRVSQPADASHGRSLGKRVFDASNQQRTAEWASETIDSMPKEFRAGFLAGLVEGLVGAADDVDLYLRVAAQLGAQERSNVFAQAAQQSVDAGNYKSAERLLGELEDEEARPLLEKVGERLIAEPKVVLDAGGMELLIEHQERLKAEALAGLAARIVDVLTERRPLTPRLGPPLGKLRVSSAEKRMTLVKKLIDFEADVQNVDRREGVLKGANGLAGKRPSNARKAIDKRLDQMRAAGGPEEALAERVTAG